MTSRTIIAATWVAINCGLNAEKWAYLESRSTTASMVAFPLAGCSPVIKSIAMECHIFPGIGMGCNNPCGPRLKGLTDWLTNNAFGDILAHQSPGFRLVKNAARSVSIHCIPTYAPVGVIWNSTSNKGWRSKLAGIHTRPLKHRIPSRTANLGWWPVFWMTKSLDCTVSMCILIAWQMASHKIGCGCESANRVWHAILVTRDKASAGPLSTPGLYSISKSYPSNLENYHCCSGVWIVWWSSKRRLQWSDWMVTRRPNRYWHHFLTDSVMSNISRPYVDVACIRGENFLLKYAIGWPFCNNTAPTPVPDTSVCTTNGT